MALDPPYDANRLITMSIGVTTIDVVVHLNALKY